MRWRSGRRAFTFVEVLLTVLIIGAICGIVAQILVTGLDSYALIVNRHDALQNARMAMERMVDELVVLGESDIIWPFESHLMFFDSDGQYASFKSYTVMRGGQGTPCIYRASNLLAEDVTLFDFDYYDENGNPVFWPWSIRRINVDFTIEAHADAGTVHLRTNVFPRIFMYDNFQ